MIQSGLLLPNTLATIDQLDDPETREKGNCGVIATIEYGREMKITPWIALNGMSRLGKVCNGYSYVYGAFEEQHVVDVLGKTTENVLYLRQN
jgi:hypothetical protein